MKTLLAVLLLTPLLAHGYITECSTPIFFEEFKVSAVSVVEAVQAVQAKAKSIGVGRPNIILQGMTDAHKSKRITLALKNVPITYVMDCICKEVGLKMRIDAHALVLLPVEAPDRMQTRYFRVPPDFLKQTGK
jgi:hypothetical protein